MGRKPGINKRINENRVEQEIKFDRWNPSYNLTEKERYYNPYPPLRCEYKPPVLADPNDHEQTITTGKAALEHYNRKNHTNYKFEDPIDSGGRLFSSGIWYHTIFKAKSETSSGTSKTFFAEMKTLKCYDDGAKFMVTACRPLDGIKTTRQCGMCGGNTFLHPTNRLCQGVYEFQRRSLRPRKDGRVVSDVLGM